MERRNDPCPCGSGKRFKHCHGLLRLSPVATTRKVDFVIAGAQKSGTSALDAYLREHPEICMATRKEVHFFDRDEHFRSENVDYSVYLANFDQASARRLLGEATPSYMFWPPAVARMHRYNSAMKIIMVLRNPVARAYSHWNMERQAGREPLSFHDALLAEVQRARQIAPHEFRRFAYIERGFYARQLARMWQYFPVEQTLVFRSEELRAAPDVALARIAAFLGVADFPRVALKSIHARQYEGEMSPDDKRYLIGVFEQDIRELERLLRWDCSEWLVEDA